MGQPGDQDARHNDNCQEQDAQASGGEAGEFAEPVEFSGDIRLGGSELIGCLLEAGELVFETL